MEAQHSKSSVKEMNSLADLINIYSHRELGNNEKMITYLKERLSECVEVVEVPNGDGFSNLLVGVNCELHDLDRCLVLSGHVDTVSPSGDEWIVDAVVDNDKIVGLGAVDMKFFTACVLENIENFKKSKIPIVLCLTGDEETELKGIKNLVKEMKKRKIYPDCALVGEPTNMEVKTSNRGNTVNVLYAVGQGCHSSNPENGINSIYALCKAAIMIEEISKKYKDMGVTMNVGKFNAGVAANIVPEKGAMVFDLRSPNNKLTQKILDEINENMQQISDEYGLKAYGIDPILHIPSFEKRDNIFADKISEDLHLDKGTFIPCSEAGYLQASGDETEKLSGHKCDVVICGIGDTETIHQSGETLTAEELLYYSKTFLPQIVHSYEQISSIAKESKTETTLNSKTNKQARSL